jgi:hypothetical protein
MSTGRMDLSNGAGQPSRGVLAQADQVAAETLIRSTVLSLANGAAVRDLDEVIRRNAGRVSHADVMAGRLDTSVLGDIIGAVEQAKGSPPFNWSAATPDQIKAHLARQGISFLDQGGRGIGLTMDREASAKEGGDASHGVTAANYKGSTFERQGLTYATFDALRKEGFNTGQITAALAANRSLGLGVNDNPAATARLQRDTPWAVPHLQQRRGELQEIDDLKRRAQKAEEQKKFNEAERLRKKAEAQQKKHDEEHHRDRDRMRREKPERLPDYDDRYRRIQENLKTLGPRSEHDNNARMSEIEQYRRNPNDADARRSYAALAKSAGPDLQKRKAIAEIQRDVRELQRTKAAAVKKNDTAATKNAQSDRENEELFAALSDAPASAVKKPNTSSPEGAKQVPATKTANATNAKTQPEKTKTAAAKPPVPTA